MTHDDPDLAPDGHDERAELAASTVPEGELQDRYTEQLAGIGIASPRRHVLIIEPSGWSYIAPHLWEATDRCRHLGIAFEHFAPAGSVGETSPGPGRYWCDLDDDGNFAIGGRVAEAA